MSCVFASGSNGLPFSMPIDFEDVDHQLVAREPRLHLHRAVERLEETQIVRNRGVVNDVDRSRGSNGLFG
jgi:hypothetical protein